MKSTLILGFLIITCGILLSCAKEGVLTGGEKDVSSPVLTKTFPEGLSVNNRSNSIILEFDEHISLNNPNDNLLVLPKPKTPPLFKTKKNKVFIKLTEPLTPNITYRILNNGSITDLSEKNLASMQELIFSTGQYLDSINIKSNVSVPLEITNTNLKINVIGIITNDGQKDDTIEYIFPLPKTNVISIKNLPPGRYIIKVINDLNNNGSYDPVKEQIGTIRDTLYLIHDTILPAIPIYTYNPTTFRLLSNVNQEDFEILNFSNPIYSFDPMDTTMVFGIEAKKPQKIKIRKKNTIQNDSSLINFISIDSLGNKMDTSIRVKFLPNKKSQKIRLEKISGKVINDTLLIDIQLNIPLNPKIEIRIMDTVSKQKLNYTYDLLNNKIRINTKLIQVPKDTIAIKWIT